MYKNTLEVRKRVNEHYCETKKMGYDVVGVFLAGSQNYGVAYDDSDIDTKAILLPTFTSVSLFMCIPKNCKEEQIYLTECIYSSFILFLKILSTNEYPVFLRVSDDR